MQSPPVAALVFDLGGVIVAHDNDVMHRRLASRCRPDWTPERIAKATGDGRWATGRAIEDLHIQLIGEAGYRGDWQTFAADWCCHLVIDPAMLACIEALAAQHRVMIFSNTNAVHWEQVVSASGGRLGVFERYLSDELGLRKPDRAAFEKVAADAGLPPSSLLFFDDVEANVHGARAAGWQAEVFTNQTSLTRQLVDRGLAAA
jgi:putative hydrolase of the HAD superfamily